MPNTAVDIIVVLIILLSAGLAFVRGFVREALALGSWLLAAWLGLTQYPPAIPYLEPHISNPNILPFAAGICIFIGVMVIFIPIGFYVRSFIKGDQITSIGRSFGFLFGALRGFLLLSIFYLIVVWLVPEEKQPEWLKEANTRPMLSFGAGLIRDAIPEEQRDMVEKKVDDVKEDVDKATSDKKEEPKESSGDSLDKIMLDLKGTK